MINIHIMQDTQQQNWMIKLYLLSCEISNLPAVHFCMASLKLKVFRVLLQRRPSQRSATPSLSMPDAKSQRAHP